MAAPPPPSDAPASPAPDFKPIHSLVLDTGPLIKNDPPASTLRARAEVLYTLPSVIPEIRDPATRARVETQLLPFVTLRAPRPESVKFITAFARKTGDLSVLSRPDIEVLALGYELECERNGGDWRLRNTPGQKRLNGRPEAKKEGDEKEESAQAADGESKETEEATEATEEKADIAEVAAETVADQETRDQQALDSSLQQLHLEANDKGEESLAEPETGKVEAHTVGHEASPAADMANTVQADETTDAQDEASDDDGGDWITPSNLKKHQAADANTSAPSEPVQKVLQAAVLTSDYAMQNVALRMNLNLVAPSLARITHLKSWVLRCHGCFHVCKDTSKQFCPSCGQPTLTRTSCSTDARGNFTLHLKKNFQWNKRGNVYSVPKPVHGSSNGRLAKYAGGQNNWGKDLILAEDQKEFTRAADEQRRQRKKDIMDEDYLPDILSGNRKGPGNKIRVGAGRNVNSRRKH